MSISLASLSVEFLDRAELSQNTVRSYESTLMPLLSQKGAMQITDVSRQELEEYLNSLTHLSYTTHNRHQAIIQALLNFAVEQGYLNANPLAQLKRRKPNKEKGEHRSDQAIHYLTPQQLEERKFQVIGKGNKQRWCFYSETLSPILDNYLKYYRHQEHQALFTAQQPMSQKISRLSYRTAYRNWQKIIEQSPLLEGCRLHDLRHTFATERVGLMGIEELRALMGHENIQTTLRYQKVTSSRAEDVAKQALVQLSKV